MRAIALEDGDRPATLIELPKPTVGDHDVLVAIRAASVNGFDVYQANRYLVGMMEHRFPTVVGRDFAGVVEAVGGSQTQFAVGDEVLGFVPSTPPLKDGSFAEFVSGGQELILARKPAEIDFPVAAALPLAGSAALDLIEAIESTAGDIVLVVGATGGVGSFVVQLARRHGLTIIATALADEASFVRQLGADETIDYSSESVGDAVRSRHPNGVDSIIDLVDRTEALTELASVVRRGGHVASLLGAADDVPLTELGLIGHNVNAAPTADKLRQLAELAASGSLRVPIQGVYSIDRAGEAFTAFQHGTRGKLIIRV